MTTHDDSDGGQRPSRSQRKRDHHALIELARALAALPDGARRGLALDELLRDPVAEAAAMPASGARERQLRYIANLLEKTDHAALATRLHEHQRPSRASIALQHRAEAWRDRLLQEGPAALTALLAEYPAADAPRLRSLVGEAQQQAAHGKPPKAARALFRCLRALLAEEVGPPV